MRTSGQYREFLVSGERMRVRHRPVEAAVRADRHSIARREEPRVDG